ncbi:FAD/NAD(P)-binding domain-containing protein [Peniophora sp. CONT]|nr:FAD/NAD(P)-binding domain-containing protein [Peniophora sp. CONT]
MHFLLSLVLVLQSCVTVHARPTRDVQVTFDSPPTKRIAIVGAGAAGIATLKAIMNLDNGTRAGWEVVVFEERAGVGGLWRPDTKAVPLPEDPELPETPLYPGLHTHGPHPLMTIPNTTFPPETELLAPHEKVLQYHEDVVKNFNLSSFIKFNHSVLKTEWKGNETKGFWDIVVQFEDRDQDYPRQYKAEFDHLIVATGYSHYPSKTQITGEDEWRAAGKTIMHSMYYRRSEDFAGQNVVVVGGGPNGWDIAARVVDHANACYWSRDGAGWENFTVPVGCQERPRISQVHANGIVRFMDGSWARDIDSIILSIGYDRRVPFLTAGEFLKVVDDHTNDTKELATNNRYLRPLYEHTLSLDPRYPLGALYFNGLLYYNPTGMCNYAQGIFAAYTIADPTLLGSHNDSRELLYDAMLRREQCVRASHGDPLLVGHRPVGYRNCANTKSPFFEDEMINYLKDRGLAGRPGVPADGVSYTDPRREAMHSISFDLSTAWKNMVSEGEDCVHCWVKGRETQEDWYDTMESLAVWWKAKKRKALHGLLESTFPLWFCVMLLC